MIKTKRKCIFVFLVVFSMIFNMISLSAYAEGEVVINAQDSGEEILMWEYEPLTRDFEITTSGTYSLIVNAEADLTTNLTLSFDTGENFNVTLPAGSALADEVGHTENITFEAGTYSVTFESDQMIYLKKLTLKPASSGEGGNGDNNGGNNGGNEGGETPDTPQPPASTTPDYTVSLYDYYETDITSATDISRNNWAEGEFFLIIRKDKTAKYELEAEKGHYKVVMYAGTSNDTKYRLTNEANDQSAEATIQNTSSYSKYAKTELGTINLENGKQLLSLKGITGVSYAVRLEFYKVGDYVYYPIEDEKTLSASDVDSLADATYSDGIFDIADGGSVSFKINTAVDVFNISAVLAEESEATLNIYVNDELIATKGASEISDMEDFIFENGEKTLKIEASGGNIKIKDIKVKKVSPAEGEEIIINKNIFDYMPGGQGVGYNAKDGVAIRENTSSIHLSSNEWVRYEVDAPKAGDYLITIVYSNYGGERIQIDNETTEDTIGNVIVDGTGGINTFFERSASQSGDMILTLDEGKNVIKFTKPYNDLYLKSLSFSYINYAMNVQALYVGDYPVLGTNLITPSSDTMKIYMTNPVTTEEITNEITISGSDGTSVMYDASISENVISLDLKTSLSEYTDYTVSVNGLSCKWGDMESVDTVLFSTAEEKQDGISTFEIIKSGISNEDITIKGVIYGSHKKPIDKRYVKAYISKKGSNNKTFLKEAVSKDGGNITLDLQMPSSSDSGTYTVYIESQYTDVVTKKDFIYVNDLTENEIADDFKSATDVSLVKQAFSKNKEHFINDAEKDVNNLYDADAFYSHFISYELTDMNSFYQYYDKMYAYEELVQKGAYTVIYDEATCNKLGIDYNKLKLIQNERTAFSSAVDSISETDVDKYIIALNEAIDTYLEKESLKKDVTVSLDTVSVRYGQGFNKDIIVSILQDKLKKAVLKLECAEKSVIDSITVAENQNGTATVKKDGNTAEIEFTFNSLYDKNLLFNLAFTASALGTHSIKYSGNLIFDFNGYDITTDILSSTFNLVVEGVTVQSGSTDKTSGGSVSSGGGGGGGGGSYTPSVTPQAPTEPQTPQKETLFTDIENYTWAEESIINLTNKGVISKAEDKKYRPGDNVTREEFVKMVVCLLDINVTGAEAQFSDINKDHWAYGYIAAAENLGLISGMGDGSFGVGKYITREQMAAISARILDKYSMTVDLSEVEAFSDENNISSYAKDSVKMMRYYKIINGVGDNTFAPMKNATRAETAKIIYGLAKVVGL